MSKLLNMAMASSMLILALSLSGCVSSIGNILPGGATPTPHPAVTPTSAAPVPTIVVTPPPITPMTKQQSGDVRMLRMVEFNWDKGTKGQAENLTLIIANDAPRTVKNVILILRVEDSQRGETLVFHEYPIGDMERGERKTMSIVTPYHSGANSVFIRMEIEWGEYREFVNPIKFINKAYSVYS